MVYILYVCVHHQTCVCLAVLCSVASCCGGGRGLLEVIGPILPSGGALRFSFVQTVFLCLFIVFIRALKMAAAAALAATEREREKMS